MSDATPIRRRLLLALLVPLAVLIAVLAALHVPTVQNALLARLLATIEERTGIRIEIAASQLSPLPGHLALEGLRVATGEADPFLTAERLEVDLDWLDLLGDPPRLDSLRLVRPSFDLAAPLPEAPESEADDGGTENPLEVGELKVEDATILGLAPGAAAPWVAALEAELINLQGALDGGRLHLELAGATLQVTPTVQETGQQTAPLTPLEIQATARLDGPTLGPWTLDALRLDGPGLELTASGELGTADEDPANLRFELDAEPSRFVPHLTPDGTLRADGTFDLRRREGNVRLRAENFPAAVLAPWLTRPGAEEDRPPPPGRLELDAELRSDPAAERPLNGRATLAWQRQETQLLEIVGRLDDGQLSEDGLPDPASLRGHLVATSRGLPAEVLQPWISQELLARIAGSALDLDAELDLDAATSAEQAANAAGTVDLAWRRGAQDLLEVETRIDRALLNATGLDLDSLLGRSQIRASALPAEVLEPWLGADTLRRVGGRGTVLDLDAELDLDGSRLARPAGQADVVWRHGEDALFRAVARTLEPSAQDASMPTSASTPDLERTPDAALVRLGIDAVLLPGSLGTRQLVGKVSAPSWARLGDGTLSDTELTVEVPDLANALDEITTRWPQLAEAIDLAELRRRWPLLGRLAVQGSAEGQIAAAELGLSADWRLAEDTRIELVGRGPLLERRGEASITVEGLALERLAEAFGLETLAGQVSGTLELTGSVEDFTAQLVVEGDHLMLGEGIPKVSEARLTANADEEILRIDSLTADLEGRPLRATGELELGTTLEQGALEVEVEKLAHGIESARLRLDLDGGTVRLERAQLEGSAARGSARATIPLATLAQIPAFSGLLDSWPLLFDTGEITAELDVAEIDAGSLSRELGIATELEALLRGLRGQITLDPSDLMASRGELTLDEGTLETEVHETGLHRLTTTGPTQIFLGDHRLEIPDFQMRGEAGLFDVAATLELTPGWAPWPMPEANEIGVLVEPGELAERTSEPTPLPEVPDAPGPIRAVGLDAKGRIDILWLRPYLAGAAASGPVDLAAELSGPLEDPYLTLRFDGPEATLLIADPYATRIEAPSVELLYSGGELLVEQATARVNEGEVVLTGFLTGPDGTDIFATLDSVRYRVDYGLSMVLSGDLELQLPPSRSEEDLPTAPERGMLLGDLLVERGLLRRDLNLEREVFSRFVTPSRIEGGAAPGTTPIDLDLTVQTSRGVRLKNNLADLRLTWSPLLVEGSIDEPLVRGTIDAEPGGHFYAYGQVLRVDQATLTLAGDPEIPPTLDLTTTSSLEDPTVIEDADPFTWQSASSSGTRSPTGSDVERALTDGMATYYGQRIGERLTRSLGTSRISVRPVLVFSETDPSARLNISQELSTHVAFTISVDLRDSQEQTYLLDFHDFPQVPRLRAQVFTTDGGDEGATLQQTVEFGGGGPEDGDAPRLRRVRIEAPAAISERLLRDSLRLERGDRLPDGFTFDTEIDAAEHLRRRGYPDARVRAKLVPFKGDSVDLLLHVEPGPKVEFSYLGDKPPPALRRAIAAPYRADFAEGSSLEEVRTEAVRAFRSLGHLNPQVEVRVKHNELDDTGDGDNGMAAPRMVEVHSTAGPRSALDQPVLFSGLAEEDAAQLGRSFEAILTRAELAAALPAADAFLLDRLRAQGYPEPRILDRQISENGRQLAVDLAPGPRQSIAGVRFAGLDATGLGEEELAELRAAAGVEAGEPPHASRLAAAAMRLRAELRRRGWTDARVRTVLAPLHDSSAPEAALELRLIWEIEAGPRYHIDEIRFAGLGGTRPSWARGMTRLDSGDLLDPDALGQARRRLYGTGLFSGIRAITEPGDDGGSVVTFEVEERPRYRLGYGLRWSNEEGGAVVLDIVDHNVGGRGITLGARAFYSTDDQAARIYAARRNILGTRVGLEFFLEGRERTAQEEFFGIVSETQTDSIEAALQGAVPVGEWMARIYARFRTEKIVDDFLLAPITIDRPLVGTQWILDRRDDQLSPSRGLFASLDLSLSDTALGGDFRFTRLFSQASFFRPVFEVAGRQVTWAQSVRLGLLDSPDEFFSLEDELFFAGGERSIRGYGTRTIGPVEDLAGELFFPGGEALLLLNQELRFPIWNVLSGVVFLDAGNVWERTDDFGSDFLFSTGFGLRAATPLGIIRVDWGVPLDRRDFDPGSKVYVGFGHAF